MRHFILLPLLFFPHLIFPQLNAECTEPHVTTAFSEFPVFAITASMIKVPGEYTTISEAIEAATDGDTIAVSPGTFFEHDLDFAGKEVVLYGTGGSDSCIIDGQNASRIFDVTNGESFDTQIIGFTLQNGQHATGSAIRIIQNSMLTVRHCKFLNNSAPGIWTRACVTIGHEYNNGPHTPAAINLQDCIFDGNDGYYGGAIMNEPSGDLQSQISRCIFRNNTATIAPAIYGTQSSTISHCLFYNNDCTGSFNALIQNESGHPTIENCSFLANDHYAIGRAHSTILTTVRNCIFQGVLGAITQADSTQFDFSYCAFDGSEYGDFPLTGPVSLLGEECWFAPTSESEAVDAGDPSIFDADGTTSDIGWIPTNQALSEGCTDANACNYNPLAVIDNESCILFSSLPDTIWLNQSSILQLQAYESSPQANASNQIEFDSTGNYVITRHSIEDQYLSFNPDSCWADFGDILNELEPPVSLSFDVRINETGGVAIATDNGNPSYYNGYWAQVSPSQITFNYGDGGWHGGGERRTGRANVDFSQSQWHHVVCTVNGPTDFIFYVDGNQLETIYSDAGFGGPVNYTSDPFKLGHFHAASPGSELGYSSCFDGDLDNVSIWNRQLSEEEVATLEAGLLPTNEDSLLAFWQFNEESGTTILDSGPFGYNGSMMGQLTRLPHPNSSIECLQIDTIVVVLGGCTDPNACNFNDLATNDDGSCETMPEYVIADTTIVLCPGTPFEYGAAADPYLTNSGLPNPWPASSLEAAGAISLGNFGTPSQFSIAFKVNPSSFQHGISIIFDASHGGSSNWVLQKLSGDWRFLSGYLPLIDDVWQEVLITYSNCNVLMYIDGELVDEFSHCINYSGNPNWYMGNWPEGGRRFTGSVDDVLYSHEVLLPSDNLFSSEATGAIQFFQFDEGSASTTTMEAISSSIASLNGWTWNSLNQDAGELVWENLTDLEPYIVNADTSFNFTWMSGNCSGAGTVNIEVATEIGCTDSTACNFDPLAECDNDSCIFPVVGENCDDGSTICGFGTVWDSVTQTCVSLPQCGSGTVWVDSLMQCVAIPCSPLDQACGFGTTWDPVSQLCVTNSNCPGDYTGDNMVGAADLLLFLTWFGQTCIDTVSTSWNCGDLLEHHGYGYVTVHIGEQCWFAENLRTEYYHDGQIITSGLTNEQWVSTVEGAQAIHSDLAENLTTYGRLYNGYAIQDNRGLCPNEWHVPSDSDWYSLSDFLGGESTAGHSLKSSTDDNPSWNGSNTSGFNALPGGTRSSTGGIFTNEGTHGVWWSSSGGTSSAYMRVLSTNNEALYRSTDPYTTGYSVRCLKD